MIDIPDGLIDTRSKCNGAAGRAFLAALPRRAAEFLDRWGLRRDGEAFHGLCALVLPPGRLLQNGLWAVTDGERRPEPDQAEIARQLLGRGRWGASPCLRCPHDSYRYPR
ncbi:hypothetical protein [Streptomyces sp. Ncost-T10-10d]|uniref:hypothetical protein n=1 Tax=Streptomyces sp. Ncost-T10-10d TaxID=1839774 RepID=UPI00159F0011